MLTCWLWQERKSSVPTPRAGARDGDQRSAERASAGHAAFGNTSGVYRVSVRPSQFPDSLSLYTLSLPQVLFHQYGLQLESQFSVSLSQFSVSLSHTVTVFCLFISKCRAKTKTKTKQTNVKTLTHTHTHTYTEIKSTKPVLNQPGERKRD